MAAWSADLGVDMNVTPTGRSAFNAKNRLVGVGYDNVGNVTQVGARMMTYDAENRVKSVTLNGGTTTYVYDGDGRRVMRQRVLGGGSTESTVYVYDAMGQLMAEYTDGQLGSNVACTTCMLHADHLGSTRMVTSRQGTAVSTVARRDYLPYGDELTAGRGAMYTADTGSRIAFTGKERGDADGEFGLDYFGARYYSGAQGRFTGPDPLLASAKLTNPQSWNRYSYAFNNPLRFTDPTGMIVEGDEESRRLYQQWKEYARQFDPCARGCRSLSERFVLPQHPSGLGPEWHQGQKGKPGQRGKDHWHVTPPGGEFKDKEHHAPGTEVELPDWKPEPESPEAPVAAPEPQTERRMISDDAWKTGGKVVVGLAQAT